MTHTPTLPIVFSSEVQKATERQQPIVALESTIITHGMPYPANVETAKRVEQAVREEGAVPATIAVMNGKIHIGLEEQVLSQLAQATNVMKLSRADFAFALSERKIGSTTVAATMIAAHMAGISVFATGGIGGVHRGAETSFDISADLDELARTPVTVVCAGAKAILDLPKTLEVLETLGVPVIGYGTDALPAFWSRDSGLSAPLRADTPEALARHMRAKIDLGLGGGTLVVNPLPEENEIPKTRMDGYIEQALSDAAKQGISGKGVTPYLLGQIFELSEGSSLEANVALVINNARLAAKIAVAENNIIGSA